MGFASLDPSYAFFLWHPRLGALPAPIFPQPEPLSWPHVGPGTCEARVMRRCFPCRSAVTSCSPAACCSRCCSSTGWYFQASSAEPTRADADRATIRIHSTHKWPKAVVFDTTLPAIVPPAAAAVAESAVARPPREAFAMAAEPAAAVKPPSPSSRQSRASATRDRRMLQAIAWPATIPSASETNSSHHEARGGRTGREPHLPSGFASAVFPSFSDI